MRKTGCMSATRFLFVLKWKGKVNPMESSNQFLGTERIGKLMQKYAIPCIISLLVGALYNIVDQIFIANASYLGSYGNAANTVVFPLTVVALAIAVMIGDGCCAFVSISLGQNEVPKAKRSVGNAVVMCLVSSIVLAALYLIFADTILAMFGGTVNAETYHHSQEYFFYITLGVPFYMFGQAMNPIIRADGNPRFAMVSTLAGAALNIILDPIFIFGYCGEALSGTTGAALATVIGQFCGAGVSFYLNLRKNPDIQLDFKGFRPSAEAIKRIYVVGLPSIAMQCVGSVMTFLMNQILMAFTATAVAVFGVYFKLQSFVFMPIFGMNNGMVPIIGYNYGARKPDRVKKTIKCAMFYAEAIMLVGFLLFQFLPDKLLGLFSASEAMLAIGKPALRIICFHFLLAGMSIILSSTFQALGNGMFSLIISVCRQLVVLLPAAWLLSKTGNVNMVWWSFVIAELVSVTLSFVFFARLDKKIIEPMYDNAAAAQ